MNKSPDESQTRPGRAFPLTSWTLVLTANDSSNSESQEALNRLCNTYWYPLYAFIRRRGYDCHTAEDLTQSFFLRLFEIGALSQVRSERGRFRTFLLTSLTRFLASDWERKNRLKRGGNYRFISWDFVQAESRFVADLAYTSDTTLNFDRDWRRNLTAQALSRLKTECASEGKEAVYDALSPFLTNTVGTDTYEKVAKFLNMEKGNVGVILTRLRQRFGDLIRMEIAETVSRPEDVDDEIRQLIAASGA